MIESSQILSFNHYKKGKAYTGSRKGMRYRIQKRDTDTGMKFFVHVWPEPFCYEKTEKEQMTEAEFEFSEEGYEQVLSYLNNRYEEGVWK